MKTNKTKKEKSEKYEWVYPDLNRGQWLPKPQVYQASP